MATVEEKVDRLEKALDEFVKNVGIEFNKAYNLMVQLQLEMKEGWEKFKQEIELANERWRREMEQSLRERDERWNQTLNALSESLSQSLKERDERWNQELEALSKRLEQSLRERDERWNQTLNALSESLSQSLKERDERWNQELEALSKRLEQSLRERDERWNQTLNALSESLSQSLKERDERWNQELEALSKRLEQSLRERDERWNQTLNALSESLSQSLKERDERWEREREEYYKKLEEERRQWNLRWGELANRLGTMVEDLVYPSLPRIIKEEFNLEVEFIAVDIKKRLNGKEKEYDAIAIAGNYVFINSTKSRLRIKDVDDFVNDILEFREFYPEYKEKKLIGVLATLRVDENVLRYAEKTGFLVLAVGDELMEVKNTKGFKPKEW